MTPNTIRIAFLGIGIMGFPMSVNLLRANYPLTAWNRSHTKALELKPYGASVVTKPELAVKDADVIFTMLSDDRAVTAVTLDAKVLSAAKAGATFINTSSISPSAARAHAEALSSKGFKYIDCPVSGGVNGARDGTLALLCAGDPQHIASLQPLWDVLGRSSYVGAHGTGQIAKLANQQIVAVTIGAIAEAMTLVTASGGSAQAFRDAIRGGFAESTILEIHGQRMVERNFVAGGPAKHQLKDLHNVLNHASGLNLRLPLTESVSSLFENLCSGPQRELDHSALLLEIEKLNAMSEEE